MTKQKITFTAIVLALGCFALSPQTQAVKPPPDGCYPNFTTAEGCSALNSLSTGAGNTGLGWYALFSDTIGNFNTGVGAGALVLNDADSNTAVGTGAMLLNTTGYESVAVGTNALLYNDSGYRNSAVGAFSLTNNLDGFENSALGRCALLGNITAFGNTGIGAFALLNNDSSGNGIANSNTAVGDGSLMNNIDGSSNTALGAGTGTNPDIGSNNIYIGDPGFAGDNNVISIGGIAASGTPYENTYIGGIYDTVVADRIVYVGSDGHLGTLASSRRYKEEIKPMDKASEALFELKPVTFRYKQQIDPSHKLSFGLIAEEVAKISPDLISRDNEGKPQTVRYEAVNAMLLNEFLKEHQKVQELEVRLAQQEKQIESLTAGLQKVSAQLEATRPVPQVAVNKQ